MKTSFWEEFVAVLPRRPPPKRVSDDPFPSVLHQPVLARPPKLRAKSSRQNFLQWLAIISSPLPVLDPLAPDVVCQHQRHDPSSASVRVRSAHLGPRHDRRASDTLVRRAVLLNVGPQNVHLPLGSRRKSNRCRRKWRKQGCLSRLRANQRLLGVARLRAEVPRQALDLRQASRAPALPFRLAPDPSAADHAMLGEDEYCARPRVMPNVVAFDHSRLEILLSAVSQSRFNKDLFAKTDSRATPFSSDASLLRRLAVLAYTIAIQDVARVPWQPSK